MFKGFFTIISFLCFSAAVPLWFRSTEILVKRHRVFAVALLQHVATEKVGGVFVEDTMFFESFKSIVVQYISPQIAVIAGCISADDMIEVSHAVAGAISGIRPSLSIASFS